jgi:hypothetical protein
MSSTFTGVADFRFAAFTSTADFDYVDFARSANFTGTMFNSTARFHRATFPVLHTNFIAATFAKCTPEEVEQFYSLEKAQTVVAGTTTAGLRRIRP